MPIFRLEIKAENILLRTLCGWPEEVTSLDISDCGHDPGDMVLLASEAKDSTTLSRLKINSQWLAIQELKTATELDLSASRILDPDVFDVDNGSDPDVFDVDDGSDAKSSEPESSSSSLSATDVIIISSCISANGVLTLLDISGNLLSGNFDNERESQYDEFDDDRPECQWCGTRMGPLDHCCGVSSQNQDNTPQQASEYSTTSQYATHCSWVEPLAHAISSCKALTYLNVLGNGVDIKSAEVFSELKQDTNITTLSGITGAEIALDFTQQKLSDGDGMLIAWEIKELGACSRLSELKWGNGKVCNLQKSMVKVPNTSPP